MFYLEWWPLKPVSTTKYLGVIVDLSRRRELTAIEFEPTTTTTRRMQLYQLEHCALVFTEFFSVYKCGKCNLEFLTTPIFPFMIYT